MAIKRGLKQMRGTDFGRFQASATKEEFPPAPQSQRTSSAFSSSKLHSSIFFICPVQCKLASPHFSTCRTTPQTLSQSKTYLLYLLLAIGIGLCFFIPPLVKSVCLDLNDNDIDELLFYHNVVRSSINPPATNMRQLVAN